MHKVKIAIWDSLIKSYNKVEYYQERARAKRHYTIEDSKGALSDYLYIYNNGEYQNYEITWAIAACYLELLNYFEALKFYNKTIGILEEQKTESEEYLARLYSGKAECKMKLEDYRGANKDYQISLSKFLSQKQTNTLYILQTYTEIGRSELLLKNYENAIYFLNKAVKYDDKWTGVVNGEVVERYDLSIAYYLLGCGYYYNSNTNDACLAWSKAGDLGNKDSYTVIKENCK
jgi:tetratricopeptide (TPR) repeat protein